VPPVRITICLISNLNYDLNFDLNFIRAATSHPVDFLHEKPV